MSQVQNIIDAMRALIDLHGLELMSRYPNDLILHDRRILERAAHPGAMIAWVVGHSHTHMTLLGVHPKENEAVTYLNRLSADDRFYILKIEPSGFQLKEITRDAFYDLRTTPIRYKCTGTPDAFFVARNGVKIGDCRIVQRGDCQSRKFIATITPVTGIGELDESALFTWASHAVTEVSQSLFSNAEIVFVDALKNAA